MAASSRQRSRYPLAFQMVSLSPTLLRVTWSPRIAKRYAVAHFTEGDSPPPARQETTPSPVGRRIRPTRRPPRPRHLGLCRRLSYLLAFPNAKPSPTSSKPGPPPCNPQRHVVVYFASVHKVSSSFLQRRGNPSKPGEKTSRRRFSIFLLKTGVTSTRGSRWETSKFTARRIIDPGHLLPFTNPAVQPPLTPRRPLISRLPMPTPTHGWREPPPRVVDIVEGGQTVVLLSVCWSVKYSKDVQIFQHQISPAVRIC